MVKNKGDKLMLNIQKRKIYKPTFVRLVALILIVSVIALTSIAMNWLNSYEYSMNNTLDLNYELITQNRVISEMRDNIFRLRIEIELSYYGFNPETYLSIMNRIELIEGIIEKYLTLDLIAYEETNIQNFVKVLEYYTSEWNRHYERYMQYGYVPDEIDYDQLKEYGHNSMIFLDNLLEYNYLQGEELVKYSSKYYQQTKLDFSWTIYIILILLMFSSFYIFKSANKIEIELRNNAYRDNLTMLPNRRWFTMEYEKVVEANGGTYVNIADKIATNYLTYLPNPQNIHLSAVGYEAVADSMYEAYVLKLLAELEGTEQTIKPVYFSDTVGHGLETYINLAVHHGIMKGYEDFTETVTLDNTLKSLDENILHLKEKEEKQKNRLEKHIFQLKTLNLFQDISNPEEIEQLQSSYKIMEERKIELEDIYEMDFNIQNINGNRICVYF